MSNVTEHTKLFVVDGFYQDGTPVEGAYKWQLEELLTFSFDDGNLPTEVLEEIEELRKVLQVLPLNSSFQAADPNCPPITRIA